MTDQGGPEPTVPQPEEPTSTAPDPDPARTPEPLLPPAAAPLVSWDAPASAPPPQPPPIAPPPSAPAAPPTGPLVAWAPPPAVPPGAGPGGTYEGGPPAFTVAALLSDTFARYGADFPRLFLVSVVASGVSWLSSFASMPAAGSTPFVRPSGFVDVSGLLGLVSFVLGIVGSSTLYALAEGGRSVPFGRAIRRGIERAGWLFLTSLLLGAIFIGLFVVALIPIGLFAVIRPVLIVVPVIALFAVFIWGAMRLSLALAANVADNLNSIEAVKLSWRVTKRMGIWARLLAALFLLGLLFVPAALGTMLLVFPAMLSAMFGSTNAGLPPMLVLLVPAIVFSIFTPLTALLTFSAYRRLVPPLQPSWTTSSSAVAPPAPPTIDAVPAVAPAPAPALAAFEEAAPPAAPPAAPASPVFRVPKLGTAGKALLALAIVADIAGVLAIPYGVGEMTRFVQDFRGFPGLRPGTGGPSSGLVTPGLITFSADVDLDACTSAYPFFVASRSSEVEWLAIPKQPIAASDEVFLRISRNGEELSTTLQTSGTFDCVGSEEPIAGLQSGTYTYELLVNGTSSAEGVLLVQ